MKIIKLNILNAGHHMAGYEAATQKAFDASLPGICALLPPEGIDVVVQAGKQVIPETGIGGYCPAAHLVYISVDPENENLPKDFERKFCTTLAHEMHHAARWRGPGYGTTLGEALVSEGLACHFEMEIFPDVQPFYAVMQGPEVLERVEARALDILHDKDYDHGAWFLGSEKAGIPRYTGYSLAFMRVGRYMKGTQKKASGLWNMTAQEILNYE